nr:bifunctional ADP-dependent NAD(P)H-hydrate dehydratase/NAD(P)H-hydrate epimerase [Actinomycetota bacterium]
MRGAWSVAAVRAAEKALMAELPGGALMQRAAHGLAAHLLRELDQGGRVYGRRVLLLVGAGNNGGDALFA